MLPKCCTEKKLTFLVLVFFIYTYSCIHIFLLIKIWTMPLKKQKDVKQWYFYSFEKNFSCTNRYNNNSPPVLNAHCLWAFYIPIVINNNNNLFFNDFTWFSLVLYYIFSISLSIKSLLEANKQNDSILKQVFLNELI